MIDENENICKEPASTEKETMENTKRQNIIFIQKLFSGHSKNNFVEMFRYVLAGGLAFTADFRLLYVLTHYFGVHYLTSSVFAFSLGLVVCYILNIKWVFSRRNLGNRFAEALFFAIIGIIGLLLNQVFLKFFTESLHLFYMISKLISTFLVLLWNFTARKLLLFR
jgi:putative flippase GtrA